MIAIKLYFFLLFEVLDLVIVWCQKISIPTPRMVIGNYKGEGDIKGQNFLKEGMKLNWNFQRGGPGAFKPKYHPWILCFK